MKVKFKKLLEDWILNGIDEGIIDLYHGSGEKPTFLQLKLRINSEIWEQINEYCEFDDDDEMRL